MIFEYIVEGQKADPKTADDWIKIGIEWEDRRGSITAKSFAEEKGIVYGTFTKAMSRYSSRIKLALSARDIKSKSKRLSKREQQINLINDFRASLRARTKDTGAAINNKSMKWFNDTALKAIKTHKAAKPTVGRIYTFAYDAKHKDTLPYWDKFPLIVFLGTRNSKSGPLLYGLNLHYIPPKARQSFLEELLKNYANTTSLSNKTTLKINWSKVKGIKGTDLMIKAYLPSHIKGSTLEVKPADWHNVLLMPTQQFMSKGKRFSSRKVWAKY